MEAINPADIGDQLAAALTALDLDVTTTRLSDDQVVWLDHVAEHRETFGITSRDPLGDVPTDPRELQAFDHLLREIHDVRIERGIEIDTLDLGL